MNLQRNIHNPMNDSDLEKKLKAARVPERSAEYWDSFSRSVMARLNRPNASARSSFRFQPRLAWGFGFAFACAMLVLTIWPKRASQGEAYAFMQNEKVIRETLAMFPNQVRAIVHDEHGTELILSEKADVPDSTPLWIKICNGGKCRVVITFSGQTLQVAKETVEVLADAQGQVMLVGDRLFWSATEQTRSAAHLRIQARSMEML